MRTISTLVILLFFQISSGQILNNCSSCKAHLITSDNIKGLSIDNIKLLRNEIYARNGYEFESSRLQEYFDSKSWYKSVQDNKKIVLNDIEKKNVSFLKEITKNLEDQRNKLVIQLINFKELVDQDKSDALKAAYNFTYEQSDNNHEQKLLKEVLSKINLNDIHYYKNKGLYKVNADNGFVQILYELSIENDQVNISYNYMTHSEIIEGFNEYTDYHSENEYMYNWQFKFTKNKLNYIRLAVAG